MSRVNNINKNGDGFNNINNKSKEAKDYEMSVEKSLRDEGETLVNKTLSNLKEFKVKGYSLNNIINTSIKTTEDLDEKFSRSTTGIRGNMNNLVKTMAKKQGKVCWFIVLLFIILFFIQKYYKYKANNSENIIEIEENKIEKNLN